MCRAIHEADFATLERINASYVAENLKHRHDDVVWRVRLKDRWLWVYLVLEFQSEPDPWMALRMLVYVGLLLQDLVRRGELAEGRLPPILPLVLYNGLPEWKAETEVADLFAMPPRGLEPFRPKLVYHLIDEARLKLHPLETVRNAVDALFQLEHGRGPEDIDAINDLMEADTMLAERIEGWFAEAGRKGWEQGMQEGETSVLERLLARRFGPPDAATRARLKSATLEQLGQWAENILDAATLEDVFRDH